MTLHDRIREVVEERLRIARAAAAGHTGTWKNNGFGDDSWLITDDGDVVVYDEGSPTEVQAEHIAANDPSDAILSAEHALGLLDEIAGWRHHVSEDPWYTCAAATEQVEGETTCREGLDGRCDCGVGPLRDRMLAALATRWRVEVDG
jgi:hypothetical protein